MLGRGYFKEEVLFRGWIRADGLRRGLLVVLLCAAWLLPAHAQTDPVAELMARMTTQEKVGQLFVVAFWGRDPSPLSWAGKLIQEHKIGGVVLITSNSNISNIDPDTPAQVARLCNTLQTMALDEAGTGIPLFVAIDHEGDGFPYTRITNGVTPLLNPMAIGATWDTTYAEQVGEVAGRELAAMGINMLLGPVVDVLDDPRPGGRGDVGTRVFGGDPYWVGEMGRAYIRGVHAGSANRVLTVAKHFPGHGGSDRLPDEEVATVDKSLQELKRVELPPFFAVTNPQDPDGLDRTDALMSSHIRYRGFFGDIRQFTRPISFDAESMGALLALSQFQEWRKDGVMVSDSLGVPAVRKYFDPQLRTFPHRQIAREAFLAGNDLMILSQFSLTFDLLQHYTNVVEVLQYFAETYDREPSFAARVDDAVARILRLKFKVYPEMTPEQVLVDPAGLAVMGQGKPFMEEIARRAVTVLQPTEDSLPTPPRRGDDLLILVEERMVYECYDDLPECEPRPLVAVNAIQEMILRLYGPEGTMLVDAEHVHTRTFAELKAFLTLPQDERMVEETPQPAEGAAESPEEEPDLSTLLKDAEWIVFAMFDPTPWFSDAGALQLFLAQDAQHIYNANVVVMAYTAPYYLDVTEITKLTAYYVLYGKVEPCIEASVRALFGEVRPQGKSPVSIEGTYYDLVTQLAPDPLQRIELTLVEPGAFSAMVPVTLHLRTSLILDRNGNAVPDGTQVSFMARDSGTEQILATAAGATVKGVAEATLKIEQAARVSIAARSGDTAEGTALFFDALAQPTPTPLPPTRTPRPMATPSATPSVTPTSTPTEVPSPAPTWTPVPPTPAVTHSVPFLSDVERVWRAQPLDLLGVVVGIAAGAGLAFFFWARGRQARQQVRLLALAWIGGVVGFAIFGLEVLPVDRWLGWPAWIVAGGWAFVGTVAPAWVAVLRWKRSSSTSNR